MNHEANIAGGDGAEAGQVLSLRNGIYRLRLRLPAIEMPHEVVLHGVSQLTDALRIALYFARTPIPVYRGYAESGPDCAASPL
jgi:hypothetical protein